MSNVHLQIIGSEFFCNLLAELNFNYSINTDKNLKYNNKDPLVRVIFIEKLTLTELKKYFIDSYLDKFMNKYN
jgi:hypothetical protein